jgi:hypothetical protein
MRNTPSITTTTLGIAIGSALAANLLTGCGNAGHASGTKTSPKPTVHVLIDRSHSTDAARNRQLATAKAIHLKLASTADIHLWAYDSTAVEVVAAGSHGSLPLQRFWQSHFWNITALSAGITMSYQ